MVHLAFNHARYGLYGECRLEELKAPFPPHFHDYYTLGMLLSGTREITIQGKSKLLQPFEPVIINPGDVHSCHKTGSFNSVWLCLSLSCSIIREFTGQNSKYSNWPGANESFQIAAIFSEMQAMPTEDALSEILKILRSIPTQKENKDFEFIRTYPQSPAWPGLERLGINEGMNKFSFLRSFRRKMQLTPYRYYENLRLTRCCKLLAQGMGLVHCAQAAGYCDQSHMNRQFRKYLGFTPGLYQRAIRSIPEWKA